MIKSTNFSRAKSESRTLLTEIESKELMREAGIDVVQTRLATTREEAINLGKELGFPVVLKIASPDVVHKSDSGGVRLKLQTAQEVGQAFDEIIAAVRQHQPAARTEGATVQKMAKPGVEVIIGMSKDAQFGPVIMFGLGGAWAELIKDVSLRIAPLNKRDAAQMVREIKGYPLLSGYRGQPPVDVAKLEEFLLKISAFAMENPEVKELDLNPVFAYPDGAVAVDARIILEDAFIKGGPQ